MRLLSLDYEPLYGDSDDKRSTFESDVSCFDFDLVIWDPAKSFMQYYDSVYGATYQGLPSLNETNSAQIQADVKRRLYEFTEFLRSGRILVVVGRPPQSCFVDTGKIRTSGTGRNAHRTKVVTNFDILSALPIEDPSFERATGNRVESVGDGPLQKFLRDHAKNLQYTATIGNPPGNAIARVKGTDRAVASVLKTDGGGLLVVLPETTFKPTWNEKTDTNDWPKAAADYQAGLLDSIQAAVGVAEVTRPTWADEYSPSTVIDLQEEAAKQQVSVERARKRLAKAQGDIERELRWEQLYLGTGRQLELRVADVMKLLGGKVDEAEPGRADWRVDFSGARVVLEVKGVTKSAAEKNAAQLEKWVAEDLENSGTSAKGILVVNTWRDLPLIERTEADFPDQMLAYSAARGHCLITGLDLFVIAAEIRKDPTRADFWRSKILSTTGRMAGVPDWKNILRQSTTASDKS